MDYMVMVELRRVRKTLYLGRYDKKYPEALYRDGKRLAGNRIDLYVSLF